MSQEKIWASPILTDLIPASDTRLQQIVEQQQEDPTSKLLMQYIQTKWPPKNEVPPIVQEFWQHRTNLTIENGLLLKAFRIFIPIPLRQDVLKKIHGGHLDITKCRALAKQSVW
uniref:Integrase zinc-binding domain-containing protein n=1 Tax=Strigamia maritima TaxID=126957 RepID=T1J0S1_STRMM